MLISVIIPTYNEQEYITHCLASLQKQKLDHTDQLEIIIVDDGSTDNTVNRVKRFENVKLLHQHHQGPALARNQGAKHARGEILVFVDADMEFDPQFIKFLIRPIKSGTAKGTFSQDEYVGNWQKALARCWNWNQNLPARRRLPLNDNLVGTDFRAILKKEFDQVKGFDKGGYTDTWSLPKKLGFQPSSAAGAVFYHHNPHTLQEIFHHASWVGKREYKLGIIGKLVALARASLPVSLALGLYKGMKYREAAFFVFKIIYDFGLSWEIIQSQLTGKLSK